MHAFLSPSIFEMIIASYGFTINESHSSLKGLKVY